MAEMDSPLQGQQGGIPIPAADPALYARVQTTERGLISLSSSLNGISQQMAQFSTSLERISISISAETSLERAKERQEQQQEFLLAQQQIREGKESAVERKIQSSLSAPVQKISQKAENTLGRLRQVLTGVLFGWLSLSTINLIKRYSGDAKEKFESVRDNVLKGLNTAGQFLSSIKTGLTNVFSTISTIATRVTQHVNANSFLGPIKDLVDSVKGAFKQFFNIGTNKDGTGGSYDQMPTGSTPTSSTPPMEGAPAETQPTSTPTSGLSSLLMSQSAIEALSAPSMLSNAFMGSAEQNVPTGQMTQPSTPMVNPLQINQQPTQTEDVHTEEKEAQPAMYGEFEMKPLETMEGLDASTIPVDTQQNVTPIAQISPVPRTSQADALPKLEEPKANVIIASAPAQQQQIVSGPTQRASTFEVPSLPTSNPNNFYAMYSKTMYNVVV